MLVEFSKAVATRPLDHAKIQQTGKQLALTYDEAVLVEASATAGSMEILTKVVDATGRKPPPHVAQGIVRIVLAIHKFVASPFVAS
mmetsp:Transcript_23975/g.55929  ORF Transcript_23975/g.55929 Transcript_23975/m.55929 type:complete len:86 (+) Transcript_23975:934-1191(+)